MTKTFLLFRDGRRLRASHSELPRLDVPLLVNGRQFAVVGSFVHLNHIVDARNCLLGFGVDVVEQATTAPGWRAWWESFDNRYLSDFWQAYLFLADPLPADWRDDGALLVVNAPILSDNAGDYLLALPDENGYCFRPDEPTQFWKEIGFEINPLEVRVCDPGS